MEFPFAMDKETRVTVPGADARDSLVALTESTLVVRFGELFDAQIDLETIAAVQPVADPRPQTFLPMGVSAAVNTLGSDTVSVLGSHDGMVQIDFRGPVQGHVPPPKETPTSAATSTGGTVTMAHLIVSLQDPGDFVQALDDYRHAAVKDVRDRADAEPQSWPSGG